MERERATRVTGLLGSFEGVGGGTGREIVGTEEEEEEEEENEGPALFPFPLALALGFEGREEGEGRVGSTVNLEGIGSPSNLLVRSMRG